MPPGTVRYSASQEARLRARKGDLVIRQCEVTPCSPRYYELQTEIDWLERQLSGAEARTARYSRRNAIIGGVLAMAGLTILVGVPLLVLWAQALPAWTLLLSAGAGFALYRTFWRPVD